MAGEWTGRHNFIYFGDQLSCFSFHFFQGFWFCVCVCVLPFQLVRFAIHKTAVQK